MSSNMSVVTVRVKNEVKQRAMVNAEAAGIPLSTLINVFLVKFAADGVVPFQIGVPEKPNALTRATMKEAYEGNVTHCASIADMYAQAGIEKPPVHT